MRRYLLVIRRSGAEGVRGHATGPDDEVFARLPRREARRRGGPARAADLDWTILRPGGLTDDAATGSVRLDDAVPRGSVPRADVAAVLVGLLHEPRTAGLVLELIGGAVPTDAAVAAVIERAD